MSNVRQNYNEECEAALNKQINWELYASYVYMSMGAYYHRDDVAQHGFAKFFETQSVEERSHALKMIEYQNMRGGRVVLNPIDKPSRDEWGSGLDGLVAALDLEKTINKSLLDLHEKVTEKRDAQFADFLETQFLREQVESMKKLGDLITSCRKVGSGLGEWEFDKYLLSQ